MVITERPKLRIPADMQKTPEATAFLKSLIDQSGRGITLQNTDGKGDTVIGFNKTTHKIAYWTGKAWTDIA